MRERGAVNENAARDALADRARSLYERGYAHGSSGNLSVRVDDGVLVTPTGSCLGRLDPARISRIAPDGRTLSGDPPSKEAFLHLAVYASRPSARAIVHLHCTCAVAVSCLVHDDPGNVLPPLTAYHVMRVGTLPLVPYYAPGDRALAAAVGALAASHRAVLLANHGPVVAGTSLDDAVDSAEELEQTARLSLLLANRATAPLSAVRVAALDARFPN
ncbi:MAG: aldolase [Betaproteobacteria bacterium]|nr:aldolase [Betaproteobacteria bacterium]